MTARASSARRSSGCARSSHTAGRTTRASTSARAPGIGHVRLTLTDLVTGQQPLANEDKTIWVAFNGEIYNYKEQRARLEALGHRFSTQSDTEVIPHLYEEHGADFVHHLEGNWAIALWDAPRERLILTRDRLGKKAARLDAPRRRRSLRERGEGDLRRPVRLRGARPERAPRRGLVRERGRGADDVPRPRHGAAGHDARLRGGPARLGGALLGLRRRATPRGRLRGRDRRLLGGLLGRHAPAPDRGRAVRAAPLGRDRLVADRVVRRRARGRT